MSVSQLLAKALHLVQAEDVQSHGVHASSPLAPSCTEPYCGGFAWAQPAEEPKVDGELGRKAPKAGHGMNEAGSMSFGGRGGAGRLS